MQLLLEVAVFNMESARIAANAGADRIELCSALVAGGLTPSVEMMMQANEELRCPFFVMIRPKPGGFMYSVAEISQMKEDILMAKAHGASGFVFGILKQDGTIDEAANAALLAIAYPLPCTFHRAFDTIENKQAALETLNLVRVSAGAYFGWDGKCGRLQWSIATADLTGEGAYHCYAGRRNQG